ncbi:hypothetical protein Leryth_016070 [Lithospermum erythrorhizon]|nr:hypothetical protein Leryth_016070 [Lithospermum erythrorhizon]
MMIDLNSAVDGEEGGGWMGVGGPVCMELWQACAGALIWLPKKGSSVVYFPQGHLQHLSAVPSLDLPPHIFCRVVDVKLHAEHTSDEVFAQLTLLPDTQIELKWSQGAVGTEIEQEDCIHDKIFTPQMFCKTLTASDTSTHGGFSVPRRAAEDCFPPLDYKQQRPSQELVAKDLHGIEWKFKHIYRGQPRRHLLTTGWSSFVNKKKLVSGDAVLFLKYVLCWPGAPCSCSSPLSVAIRIFIFCFRNGEGELRLGIRRASQVRSGSTALGSAIQQLNCGGVASLVKSISSKSAFTICYNPRLISSEFIVPFYKFSKSLTLTFSAGTRFKIRFETDEAVERRHCGLVIGMSDLDPIRWPGSKWRSLLVRWDDLDITRGNRVSPWEIEPCSPVTRSSNLVLPASKRTRTIFPPENADYSDGTVVSDFGESARFQKVLQGQEMLSFDSSNGSVHGQIHQPPEVSFVPGFGDSRISTIESNHGDFFRRTGLYSSYESCKVLQGQETIVCPSYRKDPVLGDKSSSRRNGSYNILQGIPAQVHPYALVSSPSSMMTIQQTSSVASDFCSLLGAEREHMVTDMRASFGVSDIYPRNSQAHPKYMPNSLGQDMMKDNQNEIGVAQLPYAAQSCKDSIDLAPTCKSSCRLFGFSLSEGRHTSNNEESQSQIHAFM